MTERERRKENKRKKQGRWLGSLLLRAQKEGAPQNQAHSQHPARLLRNGYIWPCVQLGVRGQATATTSSSVHPPNPRPGDRVAERKSRERGRGSPQFPSLKQAVTNCVKGHSLLSCAVRSSVASVKTLTCSVEQRECLALFHRALQHNILLKLQWNDAQKRLSQKKTSAQISGVKFHKVRVT